MDRRAGAVLALVAICALATVAAIVRAVRNGGSAIAAPPVPSEAGADAEARRRAELDRGVYALEVDAQRHEQWFYRHWDEARRQHHAYAAFTGLGIAELRLGHPETTVDHAWGITATHWSATRSDPALDQAGWEAQLARWQAEGFTVTESEWHQPFFEHFMGQPARSTIAMLVHAVNARDGRRLALKGTLAVTWSGLAPREVTVTALDVIERSGPPAFSEVAPPAENPQQLGPYPIIDPVLAYDLDRDGLPELVLGGQGLLLRNRGGMGFSTEPLCPQPLTIESGVIGDFDGDGLPDLLAVAGRRVVLLRGQPGGRFGPPEAAADLPPLPHAQAITAADIDGDGRLDALIAQYLPPYEQGQMPTPYYDADDGLPLYLLRNDGGGRFHDATAGSGLEAKRHRRVYAASFIDLDGAAHADLLLSSDFAGNDLFRNDGHGHFTDVTATMLEEAHNFGMGHAIADFDGDGRLDLYLVGMSSTTARRLEAMRADLRGFPEHVHQRPAMGYGNRMYLGQGPGRPFRLAPWRDQVARTGWSWGCAAPDLDNDGFPELYVANGFVSAASSQDYCTSFWRHDIFTGSSRPDPGLDRFFNRDLPDFTQVSWNGYEHDVLYLNEPTADGGRGFLNVAHLMGVACEYDAREVIAADLDGDGRLDLVVAEKDFRRRRETLHLYRNAWPGANHWIGVRLQETAGGAPLPGTVVTTITAARRQVGTVITGDSFMSQHPAAVHAGLGAVDAVEGIDIRWGDGQVTHLDHPQADRWHAVTAPPAAAK
jgi:hypothetical protein